jgi:1-acyl-sn-glycerol-3-phosphate acyltransferase
VVFPNAIMKVYLTADDAERARRRYLEATSLNYDANSPALAVEAVHADLARRDHLDSTRAASPLAVADDAIRIDTTGRSVEEVVDELAARLDSRPAAVARVAGQDAYGAWRPKTKGAIGQLTDRMLYRFCRGGINGFSRTFWRASVTGKEHVPASGPFIVAPVHRSNIDTPLVSLISRRRLRYMGKDSLWKNRLAARFFSAVGGFPVHRGSVDRDALRRCVEVINGGEPLVIFPEGTRQSGPIVQELFEGAAYVAARTGVPIVPVGIGGSEAAMPKGAKFLHPVRIAIVIGEPIPAPRTEGRRASRREIKEVTARLHGEIQKLFDEAQRLAERR